MEVREYDTLIGFQSRKAAQGAAYFARKNGGQIDKLKLIKLMYLAERRMFERHERPIFYDQYFSMVHGPVCSSSLDGINGHLSRQVWGSRVEFHGNKQVRALKPDETDDMDEFSPVEIEILDDVWRSFGHMSSIELCDYTHRHCHEYQEVTGGRLPISDLDILQAVGSKDPDAAAIEINSFRRLESLLRA